MPYLQIAGCCKHLIAYSFEGQGYSASSNRKNFGELGFQHHPTKHPNGGPNTPAGPQTPHHPTALPLHRCTTPPLDHPTAPPLHRSRRRCRRARPLGDLLARVPPVRAGGPARADRVATTSSTESRPARTRACSTDFSATRGASTASWWPTATPWRTCVTRTTTRTRAPR